MSTLDRTLSVTATSNGRTVTSGTVTIRPETLINPAKTVSVAAPVVTK